MLRRLTGGRGHLLIAGMRLGRGVLSWLGKTGRRRRRRRRKANKLPFLRLLGTRLGSCTMMASRKINGYGLSTVPMTRKMVESMVCCLHDGLSGFLLCLDSRRLKLPVMQEFLDWILRDKLS
jgi:hypothetical protein